MNSNVKEKSASKRFNVRGGCSSAPFLAPMLQSVGNDFGPTSLDKDCLIETSAVSFPSGTSTIECVILSPIIQNKKFMKGLLSRAKIGRMPFHMLFAISMRKCSRISGNGHCCLTKFKLTWTGWAFPEGIMISTEFDSQFGVNDSSSRFLKPQMGSKLAETRFC